MRTVWMVCTWPGFAKNDRSWTVGPSLFGGHLLMIDLNLLKIATPRKKKKQAHKATRSPHWSCQFSNTKIICNKWINGIHMDTHYKHMVLIASLWLHLKQHQHFRGPGGLPGSRRLPDAGDRSLGHGKGLQSCRASEMSGVQCELIKLPLEKRHIPWLVGGPGPPRPEKWWSSSIGMMRLAQYQWENKIHGNQTTNQMNSNWVFFNIKTWSEVAGWLSHSQMVHHTPLQLRDGKCSQIPRERSNRCATSASSMLRHGWMFGSLCISGNVA